MPSLIHAQLKLYPIFTKGIINYILNVYVSFIPFFKNLNFFDNCITFQSLHSHIYFFIMRGTIAAEFATKVMTINRAFHKNFHLPRTIVVNGNSIFAFGTLLTSKRMI